MANLGFQFDSEVQRTCYEKVAGYGRELFGEMFRPSTDLPTFRMSYGSANISVRVSTWSHDNATITVGAWVITKVEMTLELKSYLLHENYGRRFGGFGIDEENDIFYEHTIVGSTCDKSEFEASVMAVALAADKYDDEIKARWGGQRSSD